MTMRNAECRMGADSEMKYTFDFKPFSPKQLKIMTWWRYGMPYCDYDGIIADGAIRSGKTVSMSLSFVLWAMASFNGACFALWLSPAAGGSIPSTSSAGRTNPLRT